MDKRQPTLYTEDMNSRPRRSVPLADALFARTRKAAIGILFSHPEKSWHLRELARYAGVSPTMIGKEMDALSSAGIVLNERDGNRRSLRANPDCPIYEELRGIARKTSGLADVLREALSRLDGIDFAFVFGSVATGEERADSDVDVCVVGRIPYRSVMNALSGTEVAVGRTVNPVLYSQEEFRQKSEAGNPFVSGLLSSKRIFLIGDDNAIERAIARTRKDRPG